MSLEINAYKTRIIQAVGLLIIGFFSFSISDLCAKFLQNHYSVYQILAVSGTINLVVSSLWLIVKHGPKSMIPINWRLHLIRGSIILGTAFFMVSALKTLPLADFYGVVFLSPFFLLIFMVTFFKEKVGWHRWLALTVAFGGVIVLAGPQFGHIGIGYVYALCGAIFVALSIVALRKIGHGAPLPLYAFYPSLFISGFNIMMLMVTDSYKPFQFEDLVFFSFHGPSVLLGIIATSIGYAKAPQASMVAPIVYTQVIWGVFFGLVFFNTMPTETTIIGLIMIIGAGIYSIRRDYKHGQDHAVAPD